MKAAVIHECGSSDVLTYQEINIPKVGPGEVLIKLKTLSLNRFDRDVRGNISGYLSLKLLHALGFEGAGVVAEVGPCATATASNCAGLGARA